MNHPNDISKLSEPFQALIGNQGLNYQLYDLLPVPIEIFAPDGTAIFINRAALELNNIPDASFIVGRYNVRYDPVCLEICGQEAVDRAFRGESFTISDFPAPIQDVVDRGVAVEKPWEAATMDIFILPIWEGDSFICTVFFFTVKNMYKGRADIVKTQEYMDQHWRDEFDLDKIAQSVSLSSRHFRRIFKEVVGCTPFEYYQRVKIEKVQEKLLDGNLSIDQAFAACGVASRGAYYRLFKEIVGVSPSKFRKGVCKG